MLQFTPATFLWLLGCLLLGAGYAFLLYRSSSQLQKGYRNGLFALRTVAVAVLAFLLFAPLIKRSTKIVEKPLILVAQDNSASVGIAEPRGFDKKKYADDLAAMIQKLSERYEVRTFGFGGTVDEGLSFNFDKKLTDISGFFKQAGDQFANRNIGAIVLASDGIYNRGGNPQYEALNIKTPVYSIALGDTIPRRDLLLANVNYNNIVYLDNQFEVGVDVEAYQCKGVSSVLTVSDASGVIFSKPLQVNSDEFRTTIPVKLLAKKTGIQRFTIKLNAVSNELSVQNNVQTIFVEVLDGKQKVLIVANSPHPDLSAIRQSVEVNKNYEVKVVFANDVKPDEVRDAGLVILHQLPSLTNNAADLLKWSASKPVWFILGAQSNVPGWVRNQGALSISSSGSIQEVTARVRPDFYAFTLSDNTRNRIPNFAPLLAPFGSYGLKGPGLVMLTQQIGRVPTENPLLLFADEPQRKVGVLAGEGIWKWRLEDFQENGNHDAVEELINKTVQYLSAKDDKRKFRVYPARNSFDENERIVLNGELYNDSYELVNTPDVNIELKNKDGGAYTFLFSRSTNAYVLDAGVLPSGEYTFAANTRLGKKTYTSSGQFVISQQQAEFQQTTANHQLLFDLAQQSAGKMVYPAGISTLPDLIKANEQVKTITYDDRRYEDLIDLKIVFFVIMALLTLEWFGRKRTGEL